MSPNAGYSGIFSAIPMFATVAVFVESESESSNIVLYSWPEVWRPFALSHSDQFYAPPAIPEIQKIL